jgi:hypothetical protein
VKLILKPKGEKFLKDGGFTSRYHMEREKPVEVGGTLARLQQQNMRLQNLKMANEGQISDLQKKVSQLQVLQYIWWALIVIALVAGYFIGHVHHIKK